MRNTLTPVLAATLASLTGCLTPEEAVEQADAQVYEILETASDSVTGDAKTFPIGRRTDTLRDRLLAEGGVVELDLSKALDVAAENSREFATQRESLYSVALALTREQNEFAIRWGGGAGAFVSGAADRASEVNIVPELNASARTPSGTRVVAGFVNTFLKSLLNGNGWDPTTFLNFGITQPLLRGSSPLVVRESLTQAERNVVYAVRTFERFRESLAIDVVSAYLGVLQDGRDLESQRRNYASVSKSREQIEALFRAGRRTIDDFGRAQQNELSAQNRVVDAENRLQASLDSFKFLLGLPVDGEIRLTEEPLNRLEELGVASIELGPEMAIEMALQRRWDYRTSLDRVEDAARRTLVAADALRSTLDFSAAVTVPSKPDQPFQPDWSEVAWTAGFDLQLALDRLPERNAYRSSLIALDVAMRNRDELQDRIKQQIREEIRSIDRRVANYEIQTLARTLAEDRVEFTRLRYEAARAQALDLLDAQDALLVANIAQTAALVDYALARLALVRDLEAVALEPKGLRLDLSLPIPDSALHHPDDRLATQ